MEDDDIFGIQVGCGATGGQFLVRHWRPASAARFASSERTTNFMKCRTRKQTPCDLVTNHFTELSRIHRGTHNHHWPRFR